MVDVGVEGLGAPLINGRLALTETQSKPEQVVEADGEGVTCRPELVVSAELLAVVVDDVVG